MAGKLWVLYHIKKEARDGQEKSYWNRVGRGFENKNGSYSIFFESVPVGLKPDEALNFQLYKPKERTESDKFEE